MSLLGLPWKYINEGNLHIVLQVLGTDYVLRVVKEDNKPVSLERIQNAIDFVNLVVQPLLSTSDKPLQLLEIPPGELHRLVEDLFELRPDKRRHKSALSPYVIKASNLAMLSHESKDNYCIEVKAKEGFHASSLRSTGKCYYCLKQLLKLKENIITDKSQYCPLDLFSGQRNRMKMALSSLVDNPQNNFKIFKDGDMIFHENSTKADLEAILDAIPAFQKSTNIFYEFIIEVLLNVKGNNVILQTNKEEYNFKKESRQCFFSNTLRTDTVLHKLFTLQYLTEGTNFDYDKVCIDDETIHIRDIVNLSCATEPELLLDKLSPVQLALISATARDCSIMITFTPKLEDGFPYIQIGNHKVSYKMSVTDLEPKGVASLIKRGKMEKKLLEVYNAMNK